MSGAKHNEKLKPMNDMKASTPLEQIFDGWHRISYYNCVKKDVLKLLMVVKRFQLQICLNNDLYWLWFNSHSNSRELA